MKEQEKELPDKRIRAKRIAVTIIGVSIMLLAILCVVHIKRFVRSIQELQGVPRAFEINECTPSGYLQEGNSFINAVGDANIQLPELNQYVAGVLIKFAVPIEQPLNVTLYYAETDHGYSEEYTASANIDQGDDSAVLFVGENITTCRIDIGTLEGEKFVLESIILNAEQLFNKQIQLEFYKMLILFLLAVCIAAAILALFIYRLELEKVFSLLALSLGFLYLITITPLSPPDEPHHYHSAYELSNVLLFQWDNMEFGNSSDFDYSSFVGHYNVSSGYLYIMENIGGL